MTTPSQKVTTKQTDKTVSACKEGHKKDCDMLSNVGIPKSQKDESYCTCGKSNSPTETVSENKPMKSGLRMAVNPNTKREDNDFYATSPEALELFLDRLYPENGIAKEVWEPACGQGHLSKVLERFGCNVKSTDLIDRGYGVGGVDFLQCTDKWGGDILTNPPFNLAEEFVEKGIELLENHGQLILFLKIQFLEGQKRKKLFEKYPPKYVYCHSSRQLCSRNGDFKTYNSTTLFYAWFVWEKGFIGEPIVRWI